MTSISSRTPPAAAHVDTTEDARSPASSPTSTSHSPTHERKRSASPELDLQPRKKRPASPSTAEASHAAAASADEAMFEDTSGPVGPGIPTLRLSIPKRETSPVLAYDRTPKADASALSFFRCTNDLGGLPASINTTGMHTLRLSGSEGISSKGQVQRIMAAMGTPTLYFVDLREESHAIASGHPITLRGRRDWANVGLSHEEVLRSEADLITKLQQQDEISVVRSLDLRKGVAQPHRIVLKRPEVVSERELVEGAGANYRRLTVTDHSRPRREEVDRFLKVVREMPEGAGIHVHCLGGRGRTTTFMTLYDMLHNATRLPAQDIIKRQAVFSYDYQMSTINADKPYKMALQEDRLEFLNAFHEYARANPGGKGLLWSEWRQRSQEASSSAPVGGSQHGAEH